MGRAPIVEELEFIQLTYNHGEFRRKLQKLGHDQAAADINENAQYVSLCWLKLAFEHMNDAKIAMNSRIDRATYSRAYYAAYNASKSVRYMTNGSVSLKGDDHKKVQDLPDDFPEVERWAADLTKLYEHRLRADYDNWMITKSEHSLSANDTVDLAEQFLMAAQQYLESKFGFKS